VPLYEYRCKQCGHRFERLLKSYNETVKECPVCGGEVERLISASAVQFKGSGFYSTDYGVKPSAKPASGDAPAASTASDGAASSSEKSSPAKTETASAPAPASKPTTSS
jgi:putative FmdB family regulatory protein